MKHHHEKTVITAKSIGSGKSRLKSRRSFKSNNVAREVSGPELAAFKKIR